MINKTIITFECGDVVRPEWLTVIGHALDDRSLDELDNDPAYVMHLMTGS